MIDGKRILVVVPARGGSKGLVGKNLKTICGVPLVAVVGRLVQQLAEVDRAVVSTDSEDIAKVAEQSGLSAPFMRPVQLSGDFVGDVDVLTHALQTTEKLDGCHYDIVIMLQPTSPLRTVEEVRECLKMFVENNADSVWSVSEADKKYHPLKQLNVKNGQLSYYDEKGAKVIARQELSQLYFRNGVAYVLSRDCLLNGETLMGEKSYAFVTESPHISIDTAEDLLLAEKYAIENNSIR